MLRQIGRLVAARRCCILAYHGVGDGPDALDPHGLQVTEAAFRRQIELLKEAGFEFVTASELARRARAGDRGLVALTFDDAMEDNHHVVRPLLHELGGLPATVFVISGLMGRANPWMEPEAGQRFMTPQEVLACRDAGWEIGAHTVTHPDLSTLDREECACEMRESRVALEELTQSPVPAFAYPFCRFGPAARAAVADAGFEWGFTCEARGAADDPHALRRTIIIRRDSDLVFTLRLAGVYDPLFHGPAGSWLRARTRRLRTLLRRVRGA
jgi:peptidoglycan/xylan/chitin deacetylase (PgdA/CDA1 family)